MLINLTKVSLFSYWFIFNILTLNCFNSDVKYKTKRNIQRLEWQTVTSDENRQTV